MCGRNEMLRLGELNGDFMLLDLSLELLTVDAEDCCCAGDVAACFEERGCDGFLFHG
jgi:hypothetical protein